MNIVQQRYDKFGCYRFLNDKKEVIYIGSSKNIHRRLAYQHFKNGHLPKNCYNSTARVEIVKTKDYASALALENWLIAKYRPIYNVKDKPKGLFSKTHFDNVLYYERLEKWQPYCIFREYDLDRIKCSKQESYSLALINLALLVSIVFFWLKGF